MPPPAAPSLASLTRNTYALVLAGGRGSRLHELTDWRAKPAVPFGGKFRIIDFTLSNCVNSGIRRVGVATQYKAQSLIRHLQQAWSFLDGRFQEFIEILPAQQQIDDERWYRGTADAVFQNLDVVRRARPRHVLVLSGDHIYRQDYSRLLEDHVASGADLSIGCIEVPLAEASGFGVMAVNESQRIVRFTEKPPQPDPMPGRPDTALASMGIYVFNADFLFEQLLRDADDPASSHDFGKDIIPHVVSRYHCHAHRLADSAVGDDDQAPYWRDVGTLDAYWAANLDLVHVTPELNLYDTRWPIWTWQPQVPPAKFVFDDTDRRGQAIDSMVAGGCIVSGATVRRSLLFHGVRVHSQASVEDAVILPNVEIGRNAVLRRCIVDRRCVIPAGLQVGVDPEADRQRFRLSPQGVALITPEMLGQAVHFIR